MQRVATIYVGTATELTPCIRTLLRRYRRGGTMKPHIVTPQVATTDWSVPVRRTCSVNVCVTVCPD